MKISLAADHAGLELKNKLLSHLTEGNHQITDFGPFEYDPTDDYPDYIGKAARAVAYGSDSRAIIFGGSGQGEAIMANHFQGVRAATYYGGSLDIIRLSREHNDTNVLSIGARFVNEEEMKAAVDLWLSADFSNDERHVRRLKKLADAARMGNKSSWIEMIGWFGVVLILGAYVSNIFGLLSAQDVGYLAANIVGSMFVMIDAKQDDNTQAFVINLVWVVFGIIGVIRFLL